MKHNLSFSPLFLTLLSLTLSVNAQEDSPTLTQNLKLQSLLQLEEAMGQYTDNLKATIDLVKKNKDNGSDALPLENILRLKDSISKVTNLIKNSPHLSNLPFIQTALPALDRLSSLPGGDTVRGFMEKISPITSLLGEITKGVQQATNKQT